MEVLPPLRLLYDWPLIRKGEVWRLLTNFFFFGSLDLDFLFHMYFLVRRDASPQNIWSSATRIPADAPVP